MSTHPDTEHPILVELYHPRPTEPWRYAIRTDPPAVLDGKLSELSVDASAAEAQSLMVKKLGEIFGAAYRLRWRETQPSWWTGDVEVAAE